MKDSGLGGCQNATYQLGQFDNTLFPMKNNVTAYEDILDNCMPLWPQFGEGPFMYDCALWVYGFTSSLEEL